MAISKIGSDGLDSSPTLTTPKVTTTIGVGNATPANTGSGITFPATQSASSDANTLDDYEEGTWTPVIKFGATTATQTSSIAKYTKIGNTVTCWLEGYVTNLNGGTGTFTLNGLPFQSNGQRFTSENWFFQFMSSTFPTGHKMSYLENLNTGGITAAYFTGSSGTSSALDNSHFTTSSYVYFQITYATT